MTGETPHQRKWRELRERQEAKEKERSAAAREARRRRRRKNMLPGSSRVADVIDGYAGDDLGDSPDF